MSKSIQVAIKVRPLLHREKGMQPCWRVVDNSIQLVDSTAEPFYFDHIFNQNDNNELVFDKMAKHIVHSSIQGFNGTIFAYGQTSSGKTYTMMGDAVNPGVMVLAAKELFKEIESANDRQFVLRVGYIEIYNEKIFDLLNKKNQDLKIHETPTGVVNVNCEESIITCEDDLLHYLCMGNKERTVGETNMNERSSRSHAIFRIIIESRKVGRGDDDAITQSILNLVDLAGSERADQTGARGARLKEGGHINKSLLFLSNVIKRLSESEDDKYISYRDSKLTRILQASLGGNALTSIICTIKPTAVEETQSTLSFATRAKSIKNKPQVNEIVCDATMMKRLEREIQELKSCLAEERSKNESQIKVGQLEARIKNELLKIINCSSLNDIRTKQQELRRRTWCPATTKQPHAPLFPSRIPEMTTSMLRKESSTQASRERNACLTVRSHDIADTSPPDMAFTSQSSNKSDDEHFTPGEEWCLSPPKNTDLRTVSITPKADLKTKLRSIECAFTELQEFTNLEKNLDVRHETYKALEQKCNMLESRNAALELERADCLLVKDENGDLKMELKATEDRCAELQLQIHQLTALNQAASDKTAKYEQEIVLLKESLKQLQAENRESVSLEFEYKSSKNKAKRREAELLDLLAEKDREIAKLERSLKSMSEERTRQCREELLDISRHSNTDEGGNVCVKCEDLQTMLAENEKITVEFQKLTLAYEQLQLNYEMAQKEAISSQNNLDELRRTQHHDGADCDQLRNEISVLRAKLEEVQLEFASQGCDRDDKTEECEELKVITERAQQELEVLQQKYTNLEQTSRSQEHALSSIQADYDAIQKKYTTLQMQYAKLEESSAQSVADYMRLQSANESLQREITELKLRLEDLQHKLQQPNETENAKLADELRELQTQFSELQAEHDDLSSQLMDSLQDNDTLRDQLSKLEQQVKTLEAIKAAKSELNGPTLERSLLDSVCSTPESLMSSGVGMDDDVNKDLLKRFSYLVASLMEVELEDLWGSRRVFKAVSNSYGVAPKCKLYVRNIQEVVATSENTGFNDLSDYSGKVYMQGCLKRNTFSVVAFEQQTEVANDVSPATKNAANDVQNLMERNEELQAQLLQMQEEKKAVISSTEATVNELREQINRLSAELFEKSLSVEKCTCSEYQKQIESLVKERAEMSLICQDLQEKVLSSTCVNESVNKTLCEEDMIAEEKESVDLNGLVEELRATNADLKAKLQYQERANDEVKRLQAQASQLQTEFHVAAKERDEFREKNNSLQLELCQKMDMYENESRENFRKFKCGLEAKEEAVSALEAQLEAKEKALSALEAQLEVIQNELSLNSQEFNKTREELLAQTSIVSQLEKQVSELEKLNAACNCLAFQTELNLKNEKLKSLIEQLESLQNESKAKSKQNSPEKKPEESPQTREMEKTIVSLRCLQEVVIKEKTALETELSQVVAELSKLREQIAELRSTNSEMQVSISAYADLENRLNAELSRANAKNSQNLKEFDAAKERIHKIIKDFKNECVQMAIKLQKAENGAIMLKIENTDSLTWEDVCGDLDAAKEVHTARLEEMLVTFEGLEREKTALETKYSMVNVELESLRAEKGDLVAKCIAQKTELETKLQAEKSELESSVQAEKTELESRLQAEKAELESRLQAEKAELESGLQAEKAEVESRLQAQKTELETKLQAEKTELASRLQAEKAELESRLQAQKTELETKLKELEAELVAVRPALEQLKTSKSVLETKLINERADFESVLKRLKREKSELETKLKELETELVAVRYALEQLKASNSELETKLINERADFESVLKQIKVEKSELETKLKELETEVEAVRHALEQLKTSKSALETKLINERADFESVLKRLQVEKSELEAKLIAEKTKSETKTEKSESESKLKAEKIVLETELTAVRDALQQLKTSESEAKTKHIHERNELESALKRLSAEKAALETKLSKFLPQMEELEAEKSDLEIKLLKTLPQLEQIKSEKADAEAELSHLMPQLERMKTEKIVLETQLAAATSTLNGLESAKNGFDRLKVEKSQLEERLESTTATLKRVQTENIQLECKLTTALSQLQSQSNELQSQLEHWKVQRNDLEKKIAQAEKESADYETKLEQQQVVLANLRTENAILESKIPKSPDVIAECTPLHAELEALRTENDDLKSRLERTIEEAGKCSKMLQKEVQDHKKLLHEQTDANRIARKSLETKFKEDKEKLEGTIACLISEKSALEEKLYATEMSVKRFESELNALHRMADSSGNSMDLNASTSPRKARAKERLSGENLPLKSLNNFVEEKSMERLSQKNKKQMEQKNRRLSTHDERRHSFWGATRDVPTMTDPVDKNCNCLELDRKLQECEENLFIRESQVTALNMELKNHPLKAENAALLKRLQDEQNKHRLEVKKYKQLIVDQTTKMAEAARAYASANSVHAETQTESELEQSLHSLQSKYNDLKRICRGRHNTISKLEEQLAQKENAAIDANFSTYEAGQLKALKSECETLKKQLPVLQKKYDDAKAVLQMRKRDIERLNEELAALRGA